MAEQGISINRPEAGIVIATWTSLANGDTGAPSMYPAYADRNIQVLGTFGAGGTIKLLGSNDNSNWAVLTDMTGSPISFTAAGVKMVQENVMYVKPSVTAGDVATDLTAIVVGRKPV